MPERLNRIKRYYDDYFRLTPDLRVALANQNFHNACIIYHIGLICGLLNILGILIKTKAHDLFSNGSFIFFLLLSSTCGIGLFLSFLLLKVFKTKNPYILNIPFYFGMAGAFHCILFRVEFFKSPLVGILLLATLCLILLIFCNPTPELFTLFLFFPLIVLGRNMLKFFPKAYIADLALFGLVLVILAYYKRRATKDRLQKEKYLMENRIHLEQEFTKQSFEIERQAIELMHQNRKLLKMQDETIISLSNLVENRDSDTGEHIKRTREYLRILGNACFQKHLYPELLTEDYVELAAKAAPMHDIGKIVISDSILKKPGKLTDEEFEQIKRHAKEGGNIVQSVLGKQEDQLYVQMASEIATYHHEKWNGMGYPYGLSENNIPLCARLMALADVFDALVSKRCYKEAMSFDEAFDIIKASSGSHFEPALVEVFLENREKIIAVAEHYKD